ncbi:hypothetical protein SFR_3536 [Streptomyces sp. FR-008]|nr:hypothetical protein SFR_3536 [Streptomyces sp. FR-008]
MATGFPAPVQDPRLLLGSPVDGAHFAHLDPP